MKLFPPYDCVFRVDAGSDIGFGHLRRCLVLAESLRQEGLKSIGFSTETEQALKYWVRKPFIVINRNSLSGMLTQNPPRLVIIDSYRVQEKDLTSLKASLPGLVVIDDMAHLSDYPVDGIINYNVNAGKIHYPVRRNTRLLLGPRYALIDSSFRKAKRFRRNKASAKLRLLLSMGGSPSRDLLRKAIRALSPLKNYCLTVDIAGGLEHNLSDLPAGDFIRVVDPKEISQAMANADLSLSASGLTSYELAYMGVPSLLVVLAENQAPIAEGMHQEGAAKYLGWLRNLTERTLTLEVEALVEDVSGRRRMSRRGQDLIDGKGAKRLAQELIRTFLRRQG